MSPRYAVEFTTSARREFDALPQRVQTQLLEAVEVLAGNPFSELLRVKKLQGAVGLYRIRLGQYRLGYEVRRDRLVIIVIRIGHRREVYRFLKR